MILIVNHELADKAKSLFDGRIHICKLIASRDTWYLVEAGNCPFCGAKLFSEKQK